MSRAVTYIGDMDELILADGSRVTISPPIPLGVLDGAGLVTAPTRELLKAGIILTAPPAARWVDVRSVNYRRSRPSGRLWKHEVEGTQACLLPEGPAIRHVGGVAYVCPMPGDYICGG
jgi:hypothetical protein